MKKKKIIEVKIKKIKKFIKKILKKNEKSVK